MMQIILYLKLFIYLIIIISIYRHIEAEFTLNKIKDSFIMNYNLIIPNSLEKAISFEKFLNITLN